MIPGPGGENAGVYVGDCVELMRQMEPESVHCIVTSPPYYGLRDYGTAQWEGGDEGCDHLGEPKRTQAGFNERYFGKPSIEDKQAELRAPFRDICGKCGARRIDNQIGLESSPELYIERMVQVFREARRVLRSDGVCFLNLGDSYVANGQGRAHSNSFGKERTDRATESGGVIHQPNAYGARASGLKPKDLIGIPWRVALALQADGWWLRDAIIWAKAWVDENNDNDGTTMPGSQQDRCTSAYEMVFMLTKRARCYFDIDGERTSSGATMRNVWRINLEPTPFAHFATMPVRLAQRCIKLATSERGVCPACGAPWVRVVERDTTGCTRTRGAIIQPSPTDKRPFCNSARAGDSHVITIGWRPTCEHYEPGIIEGLDIVGKFGDPIPAIVFDPFGGAGTTGLAASRLRRRYILGELNPTYAQMARDRIVNDAPMIAAIESEQTECETQAELF